MYTTNVIATSQLFSAIDFAFFAWCGISTWGKCQRELSLTNSSTCFWRSRSSAKRSTISMRSLLSSCKRMQSHKPSEEGIHLDPCLSSIFECLYRHTFALWMCALRLMGLCQRRWWHRRLWTDPSPMLRGLEFWGFHHYLFSVQLWWCKISWSASPTGGQGCNASLFSLRPYLDKPGRCGPGIKRPGPGITISVYLWMIPGDPEKFGRTATLTLMHCMYSLGGILERPSTITNSCPLGKRPSHINSLRFLVSVVSWLRVFPNFLYSQRIAVIFQSIKQKLILIGLGLCHHCRHSIYSNNRHPFSELQ